jgi:hypothetical protein
MKSLINDKLGFYTVGGRRIESKIDACLLGTKLDVHPTWHFNDHVWQSQNWTHEPSMDILELYKSRARQIREQYDYIILNYSGGSDSQAMVDAFLAAGCFIDEIVTIWNRKHTSKIITDSNVIDARNVEAEYELTTRPGLNRIINASPKTKITYIDISDATVKDFQTFDGEEWLKNTVEHLHPQYVTRWSATRDHDQLTTLDRGKQTAVLFGVDKPKICIKDGKYYTYFVDIVANSFRGGFNRPEYTNVDYVFFYWTPDMPEIIVKQSHMIRRWFEINAHLKPILQWPNTDYTKRQAYEIIVRSIIYPEWDLNTFQCVKTSSTVYCEWDNWFFKEFYGTTTYDNWFKGVNYVEQNIDKKYLKYNFDEKFDGFVGMISNFFALEDTLNTV